MKPKMSIDEFKDFLKTPEAKKSVHEITKALFECNNKTKNK